MQLFSILYQFSDVKTKGRAEMRTHTPMSTRAHIRYEKYGCVTKQLPETPTQKQKHRKRPMKPNRIVFLVCQIFSAGSLAKKTWQSSLGRPGPVFLARSQCCMGIASVACCVCVGVRRFCFSPFRRCRPKAARAQLLARFRLLRE